MFVKMKKSREAKMLQKLTEQEKKQHRKLYHQFLEKGCNYKEAFANATRALLTN